MASYSAKRWLGGGQGGPTHQFFPSGVGFGPRPPTSTSFPMEKSYRNGGGGEKKKSRVLVLPCEGMRRLPSCPR